MDEIRRRCSELAQVPIDPQLEQRITQDQRKMELFQTRPVKVPAGKRLRITNGQEEIEF